MTNSYDLVYNWFEIMKAKYGIKTTAYTIMPNHVHCILFFPTENYDLNKIVGNGKRFMAYEIVKKLEAANDSKTLLQLKEGLTDRDVKKGQKHKVFEDSFDAKPIYHRDFLLQKINYIHLNPVRGKWRLVEHWEDYEYSPPRRKSFMKKTSWMVLCRFILKSFLDSRFVSVVPGLSVER